MYGAGLLPVAKQYHIGGFTNSLKPRGARICSKVLTYCKLRAANFGMLIGALR